MPFFFQSYLTVKNSRLRELELSKPKEKPLFFSFLMCLSQNLSVTYDSVIAGKETEGWVSQSSQPKRELSLQVSLINMHKHDQF